jgi:hypothetical protein
VNVLRQTAIVAELQGRDLLRRRAVMVLFVALPLAFYYSVPASEDYSLVAGSMGVSWAVAAAGMFGVLGWRRAEPRLALAGAGAAPALLGRVVLVAGLALVLSAGLIPQMLWRSRDLIVDPHVFATGLLLMACVSVPVGLAIGALVPRELEGTLVLIGIVGIGTSVPPDTAAAKALPLWGPLDVLQVGAGLIDGPAWRGVWHTAGAAALLLAVAAWSLHRRRRVLRPSASSPEGAPA